MRPAQLADQCLDHGIPMVGLMSGPIAMVSPAQPAMRRLPGRLHTRGPLGHQRTPETTSITAYGARPSTSRDRVSLSRTLRPRCGRIRRVGRRRAHRARQNRERLAAANIWEDSGVAFAQENGRPLDPRADWQEWSDILAAAGIPHKGTHAMRHSAATFGLDEGTALAVVQELLGHSDIRVTRGYVHVSSALAADGADETCT
jgi:integrase